VPFRSWLPWAVQFDGGIAFHEYSPVPNAPASHAACVTRAPPHGGSTISSESATRSR
jgi:hypothetical protein